MSNDIAIGTTLIREWGATMRSASFYRIEAINGATLTLRELEAIDLTGNQLPTTLMVAGKSRNLGPVKSLITVRGIAMIGREPWKELVVWDGKPFSGFSD